MSEVQRFWCHEAQNILCVRASDYDALAAQLKAEALRAEAAVGDANEAEAAGKAVSLLLAERTAQRDEGLAREAEFKRLYEEERDSRCRLAEQRNTWRNRYEKLRKQKHPYELSKEVDALQQRLAEAEKLPDRKSSLDVFSTYGLGEVKGWNDALDAVKKMRGPGCADGEKS